jgi:transaldolase
MGIVDEMTARVAPELGTLKIKLFADGADLSDMADFYRRPYIRGFTTNPTLMHKAGIRDYRRFATEVMAIVPDRPVSFEVFSDDFAEMERQAREIASWGPSVYVKVPISDTRGRRSDQLIRRLSMAGVQVNVTAVLTLDQVCGAVDALRDGAPAFVSLFAGRIADTGRDPVPLVAAALRILAATPAVELIWASPRELLNIFQADAAACHIITLTPDIIKKLALVGKDLTELSLETVRMFHGDATKAGLAL